MPDVVDSSVASLTFVKLVIVVVDSAVELDEAVELAVLVVELFKAGAVLKVVVVELLSLDTIVEVVLSTITFGGIIIGVVSICEFVN